MVVANTALGLVKRRLMRRAEDIWNERNREPARSGHELRTVPSESVRLNVYISSVRRVSGKRTVSSTVIRVEVNNCLARDKTMERKVDGGSQWESNPPATRMPRNGFEARTQRRPRMASGTIVAERLQLTAWRR